MVDNIHSVVDNIHNRDTDTDNTPDMGNILGNLSQFPLRRRRQIAMLKRMRNRLPPERLIQAFSFRHLPEFLSTTY
jgi:hypothetical protein